MAESSLPRLLLIGLLVGAVSGVGAVFFFKGIELGSHILLNNILGYRYPTEGLGFADAAAWTPPETIWLILPILIIGALISGLIVWKFAPEAEGHGTDAALKAYHGDGKIRWRVPFVKALSSIITISSGGSAGCEGPTAQISAGFGSILADVMKLSARERRIAIAVGIGGGVGAIFKAPLGGAILAAEIKFRIPKFLKPVIGAGIIGLLIIILAYISPETLLVGVGCLGTGYGFVQLALYNLLPFTVLLLLPFVKILATALTIGIGASGGVFAPGLSVGGFLGGALGLGLHLIMPEIVGASSIPVFVIIGMIAVFGGVSHAPVAVLLRVLEMTGSFTLAIPAVIAVTAASILLKDHTIFKEQRISRVKNRKPDE